MNLATEQIRQHSNLAPPKKKHPNITNANGEIRKIIFNKLNSNLTSHLKGNPLKINTKQVLSNDDMQFNDQFLSKSKKRVK